MPRRRGHCWPGSTGTSRPASAAALLYACFVRTLAAELYRPILGAATWDWVASGVLAPTISLIRRWLGNDTWELLGMPVRAGGVGRARARDRRRRSTAAASGSAGARGGPRRAGLGVGGGRPGSAGRTPGSGGGGTSTRRSGCTRWARATAVRAGSRARRWAATPTPSRPPGTAGGRAPRSPSPACRCTGRWWTSPTATSASYVIPGGASGDPASPHFADQLARVGRPPAHSDDRARASRATDR